MEQHGPVTGVAPPAYRPVPAPSMPPIRNIPATGIPSGRPAPGPGLPAMRSAPTPPSAEPPAAEQATTEPALMTGSSRPAMPQMPNAKLPLNAPGPMPPVRTEPPAQPRQPQPVNTAPAPLEYRQPLNADAPAAIDDRPSPSPQAYPAEPPYNRPPAGPTQGHNGQALGQQPPVSVRSHAASIAHGMPTAEPGGLADGVTAPRVANTQAENRLPRMDAVGTEQSKYYSGQVVDPVAGTHYNAASGAATDTATRPKVDTLEIDWDPVVPISTLVGRYLFAFAGVVAITCLLAHAYSAYYVITLIAAGFVAGVLLPIMLV